MGETLWSVDSTAFRWINSGTSNSLFDAVMPVVTDVRYWYIPYILLFVLLIWKGGTRGRWCALLLAITVAIADPLSSRFIKEWVMRIRPCSFLDSVNLLVACGGGKSFPSSHAVNNMAAATIIGYFYRKYWTLAVGVAVVISFSRIYVGVHYPGDILGGWLIGAGVGAGVIAVARRWKTTINN